MGAGQRTPIRDGYDAAIQLAAPDELGQFACALVKFTYRVQGGRCRPAEPEPLLYDPRDEQLQPRLQPGTDFWPLKDQTDFVVRGSAFAPGGKPVERMTVAAQVGETRKEIDVFGDRKLVWRGGTGPTIGPPESFEEMPLTYQNAYGGIDWRVALAEDAPPEEQLLLGVDHPGLYPRNPVGKGYLVEQGAVPGMMMPNLEDPSDLLTAGRLIVGDPKLWYRQPLPWCFDWVDASTFPRCLWLALGIDAWYPGPEDEQMPEVARGFLPPGYRALLEAYEDLPHPRFRQGGSTGLVLPDLEPGTPVSLEGMHPYLPRIRFSLPEEPPRLEFDLEGTREEVEPWLHSIVCCPAETKVTMLYGGLVPLHRGFIPGIHKHIPIAVRINGDEPVCYETPPTIRERLDAAMAKQQGNAAERA